MQPLRRAPTSAQVGPPSQQRQQQVTARRFPSRVQLPSSLHGACGRVLPPSDPELLLGPVRPPLQRLPSWRRSDSCRCWALCPREASGRQATGPRRAERRGAGPRGGAGPGSRSRSRGHWRLGAQKPLGLHFPRMETELLPSQGFPQMLAPAPKQVH